MMVENNEEVESKYHHLQNILKEMGSVLIAFSGGVDSALLLRVAGEVLGNAVLAVTARSETMPRHELEDAFRLVGEMRVRHRIIESHELDLPEFIENSQDRCYICKKHRFGIMRELAREKGATWVADGENVDDLDDYRPGRRAARDLGVRSPLREAGLSKQEIRFLSERLGLFTWNKPAYACLASRIPYGSPITAEKLGQVDAAEECIRRSGWATQVRVRHYGDTARIEVDAESMTQFTEETVRRKLVKVFKELGFECVTLDLEGYRRGSLNRALGE